MLYSLDRKCSIIKVTVSLLIEDFCWRISLTSACYCIKFVLIKQLTLIIPRTHIPKNKDATVGDSSLKTPSLNDVNWSVHLTQMISTEITKFTFHFLGAVDFADVGNARLKRAETSRPFISKWISLSMYTIPKILFWYFKLICTYKTDPGTSESEGKPRM